MEPKCYFESQQFRENLIGIDAHGEMDGPRRMEFMRCRLEARVDA